MLINYIIASYNYINELININEKFDGGIYSYQEHLIKPDYDIYNLLINRFNLNKDETIFFDDKEKNDFRDLFLRVRKLKQEQSNDN